jgi:hypothetical protein
MSAPLRKATLYMPSKREHPRAYLFHIRDNVTLARSFVGDLNYDGFRSNRLVFYAVTRALEIISEASRRQAADGRRARRLRTGRSSHSGRRSTFPNAEAARAKAFRSAAVEQELRQLGDLP